MSLIYIYIYIYISVKCVNKGAKLQKDHPCGTEKKKKGENIKGKIRGQPLVATVVCRTIFII